ncbi:AAA family ATPase [Sodalis sp. RH21]|uniref:AAA family ATPase n=1 Tax=unclassified Sodalis (in: enterobacteria) TaxID=2636512 RepID=UPI0039B64CC1
MTDYTRRPLINLPAPTLHMICGKIGAGKSTLAQRLSEGGAGLLIVEDRWLATLYPGEIVQIPDYIRCSGRIRQLLSGHLAEVLRHGLSVVLDVPLNTPAIRAWALQIAQEAGAGHVMHFLDLPDVVCKQRLHARNAGGQHPYTTSDEDFDRLTRYFVPPVAEEGLNIVRGG